MEHGSCVFHSYPKKQTFHFCRVYLTSKSLKITKYISDVRIFGYTLSKFSITCDVVFSEADDSPLRYCLLIAIRRNIPYSPIRLSINSKAQIRSLLPHHDAGLAHFARVSAIL